MIRREFLATAVTAATPMTALCITRNDGEPPDLEEIDPFPHALESEWRSKWGSSANTARTDAPGPDADAELIWEQRVDSDGNPELAVADGVLYVAGQSGRLLAMDTDSESVSWTQQWDRELSSVAVDDENTYVVVGSDTVAAVDRSSGAQRWSHRTGVIAGSLIAATDGVYAIGDRDVYAFEPDGTIRLRVSLESPSSYTPAIHDESVYVGTDEGLVVIDRTDGGVRWDDRYQSSVGQPPAVDGETVYLRSGTQVSAVDVADGSLRWQYESANRRANPLALSETQVVVTGKRINAIDRSTGEGRWESDDSGGPSFRGVATASGTVFAMSGYKSGNCYRLDPADGSTERVWTSSPPVSAPLIVDEYLFFTGSTGTVRAIGPATD